MFAPWVRCFSVFLMVTFILKQGMLAEIIFIFFTWFSVQRNLAFPRKFIQWFKSSVKNALELFYCYGYKQHLKPVQKKEDIYF